MGLGFCHLDHQKKPRSSLSNVYVPINIEKKTDSVPLLILSLFFILKIYQNQLTTFSW